MSMLLRIAGVSIAFGLAVLAASAALVAAPASELPSSSGDRRSGAFSPLPAVNEQAANSVLAMSPFVRDRSAFDRTTALAPPTPPVEVRLTGIFKVGKELRASLVIGGRSVVVRTGDETEAGKVAKLEPDAVLLTGPTERRLEMFK
jgi:magnesium-transporting ATPase (P-type)